MYKMLKIFWNYVYSTNACTKSLYSCSVKLCSDHEVLKSSTVSCLTTLSGKLTIIHTIIYKCTYQHDQAEFFFLTKVAISHNKAIKDICGGFQDLTPQFHSLNNLTFFTSIRNPTWPPPQDSVFNNGPYRNINNSLF